MVKKNTANKNNLVNVGKRIGKTEERYAQILCIMSTTARLKIYKKLASLLRNRFSLMDALEKIYNTISNEGENTKEPLAVAIACWSKGLSGGATFAVALKGWAPSRERLMLAVGDASDLEVALVNLIKVTEGSKKIIGPLIAALAYPAFLACMAVLMIWAIGSFMVPPMLEAVPPEYRWQGMAKDLVVVSLWIKGNAILAFSILPIIFFLVFMSFSTITGRVRVFLDRIPPWSLYRIFMGVCWLLALSALVKSGSPVSSSMRTLRADANRYLKERIDSALSYVNNGENLGNALFKTRMEFPDKEIIGDLKVYSELDNFEEALDNLANEWLEDSIVSIEQKASVLNIVAILFICGVVAWSVMAVFEMQNQITSALGL